MAAVLEHLRSLAHPPSRIHDGASLALQGLLCALGDLHPCSGGRMGLARIQRYLSLDRLRYLHDHPDLSPGSRAFLRAYFQSLTRHSGPQMRDYQSGA